MCKVCVYMCVRTCVCVMQHAQTHTCFESVQDSESCALANLTCLLKVCMHVRVYMCTQMCTQLQYESCVHCLCNVICGHKGYGFSC